MLGRSGATLLAALALGASSASAQIGIVFNRPGWGARAAGMAHAFIAISDDGTAASRDPAGLNQLRKPELSVVGRTLARSGQAEGFRTRDALAVYSPEVLDGTIEFARSLGLGAAFRPSPRSKVAFDLTWDDWTGTILDTPRTGPVNLFDALPEDLTATRDTPSVNAGTERLFFGEGYVVPLRFEAAYEPQGARNPYTRDSVDYFIVAAGTGYNTNSLKFDAAARHLRRGGMIGTALALAACVGIPAAGAGPGAPAGATPEAPAIAQSLVLIGDAGKPAKKGEPVLVALRRELGRDPARTTVVFLGDNLYPRGLPAPHDPRRAEMERRIDEQIDAVRGTGARAVFIPGNHDWDAAGRDGWNAVHRQQAHVEERGGRDFAFLPPGGCPGPAVLDLGPRLRLVAVDSQWFLQGYEKPVHPTSSCAADSEEEVAAGLREALEETGGREAVVVTHHPLVSGGPHGGRFGLKQHIFPLTDAKRWLFVPLPVVGSIYPLARRAGLSSQDLSSEAYGRMRALLRGAARVRPPLAWASGHEHVLQVIESPRWGRVLVSGAGIYGHVSPVRDLPGSRYRASRAGYMRLDVLEDGRRHLTVVEVAKDGGARSTFAAWLQPPEAGEPWN